MIGNKYWSPGITVEWHGDGNVSARLQFFDDGFGNHHSTEGGMRTRYQCAMPLSDVIDLLKGDADRLGIKFRHAGQVPPALYAEQDGEGDPAEHYCPPNWRELLAAEAERIGWAGPRTEGIES